MRTLQLMGKMPMKKFTILGAKKLLPTDAEDPLQQEVLTQVCQRWIWTKYIVQSLLKGASKVLVLGIVASNIRSIPSFPLWTINGSLLIPYQALLHQNVLPWVSATQPDRNSIFQGMVRPCLLFPLWSLCRSTRPCTHQMWFDCFIYRTCIK
jgi:hypothetical protein